MQDNVIKGGKVLVFGDLHLSAVYEGQHKNYQRDCYFNMDLIKKKVDTDNPNAIIFAGDIIGVNERNIRDHQFLMRVIQFFEYLNSKTDGKVYSVKGNHDVGDFSDFDFLVGLGLLKNPQYVDYLADNEEENLELRFHLVNYGMEKRKLLLTEDVDCATDIVIGHAEYYIDGVTNWYSAKQGIEVASLDSFIGVSLIFSGHIHTPSSEMLYTTMKDGKNIGLFYMGSPSRTAERFDDCWYLTFEYDAEARASDYNASLMGLEPASEVFYPKENFLNDEENEEAMIEAERSEALTNLVENIMESRLATGDIKGQIKRFPGVKDDVKALAMTYYNKAVGGK